MFFLPFVAAAAAAAAAGYVWNKLTSIDAPTLRRQLDYFHVGSRLLAHSLEHPDEVLSDEELSELVDGLRARPPLPGEPVEFWNQILAHYTPAVRCVQKYLKSQGISDLDGQDFVHVAIVELYPDRPRLLTERARSRATDYIRRHHRLNEIKSRAMDLARSRLAEEREAARRQQIV